MPESGHQAELARTSGGKVGNLGLRIDLELFQQPGHVGVIPVVVKRRDELQELPDSHPRIDFVIEQWIACPEPHRILMQMRGHSEDLCRSFVGTFHSPQDAEQHRSAGVLGAEHSEDFTR